MKKENQNKRRYIYSFFVAIDQLGNALAGGNPDNTISSRVGYENYNEKTKRKTPIYWKIFKIIIDFSFYPIDGKYHCKEAYFNDAGELFDEGVNKFMIPVLAVLIIFPCLIVIPILYLFFLLKLVSPKTIDREKNMKNRIYLIDAKIKGALRELQKHPIKRDFQLKSRSKKAKDRMLILDEKINKIE